MDFSFSGLKTAVLNLLNNAKQKGEEVSVPDLCASYRKAVVTCLTENFFKAVEMTGAKTLAAAGGVSANRLLRRELERLAKERGLSLYLPDLFPVRGQRRHDRLPGVLRVFGGEYRRYGLERLRPEVH